MLTTQSHHGLKTIGVHSVQKQAAWAQKATPSRPGRLARVRPRRLPRYPGSRLDANLVDRPDEHIGVHNFRPYFRFLKSKIRSRRASLTTASPGRTPGPGGPRRCFIAATSAPDGRVTVSGRINHSSAGRRLEVVHEEICGHAYALTLPGATWCPQSCRATGQAVPRSLLPTARFWALYKWRGSRLASSHFVSAAPGGGGQSGLTRRRRHLPLAAVVVPALAAVDATGPDLVSAVAPGLPPPVSTWVSV